MKEFPKLPESPHAIPPVPASPSPAPAITTKTFSEPPTFGDEGVSFIMKTNLQPKHRDDPLILKYILAYCECRDNRQAAEEAGISAQRGMGLKRRKDIHECINRITESALVKHGFDVEDLVARVKNVAFVDPVALENADGSYKSSMSEIDPETRRAIKKFKVKNIFEKDQNGIESKVGELIEVEFYDRLKGVEMLGREKGVFKETSRIEHDVTSNMKELLLASNKRADDASRARQEADVIDVSPEVKDER